MKKPRVVYLVLLSILFIVACNSNRKTSDIHLNHGEKWQVNAEMKPHIQKGNELFLAYVSQKDTNYHMLAENLKSQNNLLISSCTMTGESHDELHKWLHPYMNLIEELSNASSLEEAERVIPKLEKSFSIYKNHFE
jgi:hypothetical protein